MIDLAKENLESWSEGVAFDEIPEVGPTERHPDALWLFIKMPGARLIADTTRVSRHDAYALLAAGIEIGELRARKKTT